MPCCSLNESKLECTILILYRVEEGRYDLAFLALRTVPMTFDCCCQLFPLLHSLVSLRSFERIVVQSCPVTSELQVHNLPVLLKTFMTERIYLKLDNQQSNSTMVARHTLGIEAVGMTTSS